MGCAGHLLPTWFCVLIHQQARRVALQIQLPKLLVQRIRHWYQQVPSSVVRLTGLDEWNAIGLSEQFVMLLAWRLHNTHSEENSFREIELAQCAARRPPKRGHCTPRPLHPEVLTVRFQPDLGIVREPVVCQMQVRVETPNAVVLMKRDKNILTLDFATAGVVKGSLHYLPSIRWLARQGRVSCRSQRLQTRSLVFEFPIPECSRPCVRSSRRPPVPVAVAGA